ncbi:sulfotransferase family cytosolic 1B member 1-like isoform X1 [Acropora millepora]|uniref:sulfotransferase family cytosolic 1B member 1-like isoform X1 n=1 Tax=Acropora millepora TaxID=45264 RepID=UPI001CF44003|nr:sulfotransferase family cytosolic 1B member 1-like isoform X1 [Acropora millepora]
MASENSTEAEWTAPSTFLLKEIPILNTFTPDPEALLDYVVNFQTRPDDVILVSYPRSGTNWMREILWQLYNNGEVSERKVFERVPLLERAFDIKGQPGVRTLPSPRLISSHLTYDVIPKGEGCKYIYIARNPKDVAVSYYEFMKAFGPSGGYNGPWEFFARIFVEGKVPFGLWNKHVLEWWKRKDNSNVLFLKYEDLKKDLTANIWQIAEFLEKPVSKDIVNKITHQCTFKEMTKNMSAFTFIDDLKVLRKGEIGDWKNYFTPEIEKRFETDVMKELMDTGLTFDFEP